MLRSLRMRLLLMVFAVITLAGVATWVMFGSLTRSSIQEFEASEDGAQRRVFADLLFDHYARNGNTWENVGPVLDRIASATGRMPILVLSGPRVVLAPSSEVTEAHIQLDEDGYRLDWRGGPGGGDAVGVLLLGKGDRSFGADGPDAEFFLGPEHPGPEPPEHRVALTGSIYRSAAIAVGVAALTALLLAFALSRRILGPVEALTAAVRGMSSGQLEQRVPVRSHDEIGELAAAFNAMADHLSRMERLRRDMTTDVAHELRTPVTNIRAQLEAMQDGLLKPDAGALASLHEEIMHLGGVIDDLQELSVAEAGALRLKTERLSATAEMRRAVSAASSIADGSGVTLAVQAGEDLPDVRADALRLGQVLRNLIANAIAHTPNGGMVTLGAQRDQGALAFEVRDTGEGIPAEHLPHLFDRFYRADASRSRATGGAGLGLPIARKLVEAMGGRIEARSAPGEGAVFRFTLPTA